MKFYCENCKSTIETWPEADKRTRLELELECPLCGFGGMRLILEDKKTETKGGNYDKD
jgi:DNA-directed RNA polymerase subunit RPC12/RpoP